MIAIDTNLLVYAHRPDMPLHEAALALLRGLPGRGGLFGLPWPCLHEFLAVVTNPRIFRDPRGNYPVQVDWSPLALDRVTERTRSRF